MNEDVFKEILARAVNREFAEFDNAPEHKFSLKRRLAMKRIFARFERNVRKLRENETLSTPSTNEYKPHLNLRQRLFIAAVIIILMTFLVGWVAVFVSENFHGTVYHDYTVLTPKNTTDCPQIIEYKYSLEYVPEGFEQVKTVTSRTGTYTMYKNISTNQTISLFQWVKTHYQPSINTEYCSFEEIDVNNEKGLCIDFSDTTHTHSLVVWDNGDYIIEIVADLDKELMLNLSNSTNLKIYN